MSTLTCPACGKTGLAEDSAACPRCSCELGELAKVSGAAREEFQKSLRLLRQGSLGESLAHAEVSWTLRHSREAAQAGFVAAIALGGSSSWRLWERRLAETGLRANGPS